MPNQAVKPTNVHEPIGSSYSHASKAGNTVYVAGQVALDADGNLVGRGDFEAQAKQVFTNLQAVLEAAGASTGDVVKLNHYVVGQQDLGTLRRVRQSYFAGDQPAATLVFVSGLADPGLLIEVEAIAVVGSP